jgi:hypothetical protein
LSVKKWPPRRAGWQPALDIQAIGTVATKRTLAQRVCGHKPVTDRRSGALAGCSPGQMAAARFRPCGRFGGFQIRREKDKFYKAI